MDTQERWYRTLPPREAWGTARMDAYWDALPQALAGVLRQFCSAMLDMGRDYVPSGPQAREYRVRTFRVRDNLLEQLEVWLEFWGITDPDGQIAQVVRDAFRERHRDRIAASHEGHRAGE